MTKHLKIRFIIVIILILGSFSICFSQVEETEDIEYLDMGGGDKIPLYADPCEQAGEPKELAAKFISENRFYQREVVEAKEIISAIKSGTVEDKKQMAKIIEIGLYNWACENGFIQKRTRNMGWPYFLKNLENQEGIFVGIQASDMLHSEGVRQGYAEFELDVRGRFMDTYYLQVHITDITPETNKNNKLNKDEKAEKVLNEIVAYSYKYAVAYYTALIELAAEMDQE